MKNLSLTLTVVSVGILVLMSGCGSAFAGGPWKWQQTLALRGAEGVMDMPTALFVDEDKERYYVVDSGNNRLVSFDRKGELVSSFNAGGKLQTPYDMVRDQKGRLLVVEKGRNSLTVIDLKAKDVKNHFLRDQGQAVYPDQLELAGKNVLLLDRVSGGIIALDENLKVINRYSCDQCEAGFVDFKVAGDVLWALEQRSGTVYRFPIGGGAPTVIKLAGKLDFPSSLAISPTGRLFVLDRHESKILVFDPTGEFKYSFLAPGQSRGRLYYAANLLFDPWGNLCVVDEGNARVQLFSRR